MLFINVQPTRYSPHPLFTRLHRIPGFIPVRVRFYTSELPVSNTRLC